MGPDKRRIRMAPEERLHLGRISRLGAGPRKRHVDVVVNEHNQTNFCSEVDQTIERLVLKTCDITRDLCGNKFLMNAEFTNAGKNTGKSGKHASNMIGG